MLGRWGDGGVGNRPEYGRWRIIKGHSSLDMWVPEKTSAERDSVYNNFPTKYGTGPAYGIYVPSFFGLPVAHMLFDNTTRMGTGPCWNNYFAGSYLTPAGCPSGFTEAGLINQKTVNPNLESGRTGVHHYDARWMFYIENGWGCSSSYPHAGISIRLCYMRADERSAYH